MRRLVFTKMQGLGNDFVVINQSRLGESKSSGVELSPELARRICDRRFGVGADQILLLKDPKDPTLDVRMEILNADGSTAEMCGNGIRAVALYVQRRDRNPKAEYRVETLGGTKTVTVQGSEVAVDMGNPILGLKPQSLQWQNREYAFYEVNVGNPHAVFYVDELEKFPVEAMGPVVEKDARFPNRTNVEFVQIAGPHSIRVRVWERGAGITLACGTGACASAVASIAAGKVASPVEVLLPGGRLQISWNMGNSPIIMEGPAEEVFEGELSV